MRNVAPTEGAPTRVLDVGTGSGVLAIAALRWADARRPGAARAECLDVDPLAVKAAAANAAHNGLAGRAEVYACDERCRRVDGGGPDGGGDADVVLANILAPTLIALEPYIARRCKPGARICLSGLLEDQAPSVVEAYQGHFEGVRVVRDGEGGAHGWVVVEGVRAASGGGEPL